MIKMTNLEKTFDDKKVLTDVNIDIRPQEIFGLLGPSGSGKTTIINILTKQIKHDAGEHFVDATAFETGLMLDEDGLYARLTCQENLELFASIYGVPKEKVIEALENVGLGEAVKKEVAQLSKGMRQRLALARAVLHRPKVLFLDEPTSGLDPVSAKKVHEMILDLRDQGTTIFLTTHNMDEAAKLCDRIALLNDGQIVEERAPLEICERHEAMKTVPDLEKVFFKMTGANLV